MAYLYRDKLRFYEQAFEWAEKAAEVGFEYNLAYGYEAGIFGGKDYDLARELHMKGIETGKAAAIHMADLAYNYANGEGVKWAINRELLHLFEEHGIFLKQKTL